MKPPLRPPAATRPFGVLLLCLLAACQDTAPTGPAAGPRFDISEARFGDGNSDFFFSAPLAANPSASDPTYDAGASNGGLRPHLRVCETDGAGSAAGCTLDVTALVTGSPTGLALTYDADAELYQVNFSTRNLETAKDYRLEIWGVGFETDDREAILEITFPEGVLNGGPRWLFGWRDIRNSPSTAACTGLEEYCLMQFGSQTVPVKVRIEDFVFCPVSRDCAVQFVASGQDANLEAIFGEGAAATSAQLFIPGQQGTDFSVAFEPCSPEDEAAARAYAQIPLFGPCVKSIVPPVFVEPIVLTEALTVSYCEHIDHAAFELAFPESQIGRVAVHHFSTAGDPTGPIVKVEAWPEVGPNCADPTAGGLASVESDRSLIRWARDAGRRVRSLFEVRPLLALDRGGGGQGYEFESFWMLGLPTKLEYELEGDEYRTAAVGSPVTLRVKATDSDGLPVMGASPKWSVVSAPGAPAPVGDADVLIPIPPATDVDGISQTTVKLSSTEGENVFHASGVGLADPRDAGCTLPGVAGVVSCNGPLAAYDPFRPIATASDGGVLTIPEDTFLPFTVFGCTPGRGTPSNIDGTLAPGEWDCANTRTFSVNLSGGSRVDARLYWMNDDEKFHIAVSVPGTDRRNALRLEWDNSGDAPAALAEGGVYTTAREPGDDVWEFDPRSSPADEFIDEGCSGSGQSGCGSDDEAFGGAMQTEAAFNNSVGGVTVYEMSHPLSTEDLCTTDGRKGCGAVLGLPVDIGLDAGDAAGFFVTLSLGSGAQGDTQDPGFLQYLKVVIK